MKVRGMMAMVLLVAMAAPALAEGRGTSHGAHMRPQLFHDRSPHIHKRDAQQHHGS